MDASLVKISLTTNNYRLRQMSESSGVDKTIQLLRATKLLYLNQTICYDVM